MALWGKSAVNTVVHTNFEKYKREIEKFLTRRLSCPDAAADITQDVFLRLLRSPANVKEEIGNVRAYLYKIASNAAINHNLSEKRRRELFESTSADTEKQIDDRTPERITSNKQQLEKMADALKELSPLAQQVFVLARIKGMKQTEVAAKLNIHITTVEKNLSKAVKHCYSRILEEN